jgi:hypothetical protein
MKNVVILVAIIVICLIAATIPMGNTASDNYNVRVRWLAFVHEKLVMDDYKIFVEFEIPSINHYESKQTPEVRYASQLTPLIFNIQESWLNLSAKLTVVAFWHLNDVIIDINPNPADGHWTPGLIGLGKKASALVISYKIWAPAQFSANGEDDGYIADLNNDAYIKLVVETLKDGEVIPEFTSIALWLTVSMVTASTAILIRKLKKQKTQRFFSGLK